MPRLPVRLVSPIELQQLFNRLDFWTQIQEGTLTTEVVPRSLVPASNPRYAGGTSQHLIHRNSAGQHVCTTHRILAQDGSVLHWDESDVHLETEIVAKSHEPGRL